MKRGKYIDTWYPLFIDKWLFGSTRHELIIRKDEQFLDLRGIWQDLLALSKKDGGYIRANESTPYPHEQLAGMFCVPLEMLELTIKICLDERTKKIVETSPGIYYVPSTETYSLSDRWKREFTKQEGTSEKTEQCSKKTEVRRDNRRKEDNKEDKDIKVEKNTFDPLFEELWKTWPREGRFKKKCCRRKFLALCKAGKLDDFKKVQRGYINFLEYQEKVRNFHQQCMHLSTFLGDWEEEKETYLNKDGEPRGYKPGL